ncbi:unnamed protein product [Paramecium octaurelia]|uniref:Uncharacterized protein n=1 Tax=Paramecium octaurelia TaxID=43137 RepID=A0A8S1YLJ5_PAROT|nr:unnamed protein product [Paramecium octaurelia]
MVNFQQPRQQILLLFYGSFLINIQSNNSQTYGIMGIWTQLSDGFSQEYQVIYSGEYHNGKKVGRWDILAKKFETIQTKPFKQMQIILLTQKKIIFSGGGSYVEGDEEIKIGEWIELDDDIDKHLVLFWKWEYKNGKKVGQWAFGWIYNDEFIELEGGSYHEGGDIHSGGGLQHEEGIGIKFWKWIDQTENIFLQSPSILYEGEYSNSIKIGEWGIFYLDDSNKLQRIGGGSYDKQSKGFKIGSWIEINDEWNQRKQITQIGEYKNGRKVGQWIEMNLKKNQNHNITNYDN